MKRLLGVGCIHPLGCAFRFVFWFLPALIFRNSGNSAEFPEFRGKHVGIRLFQGKINDESSAKTLHPPALVYSCTSPQFYSLKGSDHVLSTYYSVIFLLTWPFFCRNTTPNKYCCSFTDTRPVHFFTYDP